MKAVLMCLSDYVEHYLHTQWIFMADVSYCTKLSLKSDCFMG